MGDGWHQQTLRKVNVGKQKQCITSERGELYFSMFKIIAASDKTVDYRAKQFTQTR